MASVRFGVRNPRSQGQQRLGDAGVGTAAAKIAAKTLLQFFECRVRIVGQKCCRRHDESGGAIAALRCVRIDKRLLQRIELTIDGERFDRGNGQVLRIDCQDRARVDALPVGNDRAGAAGRAIADLLCARESEFDPQDLEQRQMRLRSGGQHLPIHI